MATKAGGKLFVCATPQQAPLTLEQFEALVWVEVKGIGQLPDTGPATNIVRYDTLDEDVSTPNKGTSTASEGTLEMRRIPTDPGQILLREMGVPTNKLTYATKYVSANAPAANTTGMIEYNLAVIAGPVKPGGGREDFELERYNMAFAQMPVTVEPTSTSAPTNTGIPAISGIAIEGNTLTAVGSTWNGFPVITYAWEMDDAGDGIFAPISGATSKSFTLTEDEVGNAVRVAETGTTSGGSATAYSAPTQIVAGL